VYEGSIYKTKREVEVGNINGKWEVVGREEGKGVGVKVVRVSEQLK
jgi:hypothetical protein